MTNETVSKKKGYFHKVILIAHYRNTGFESDEIRWNHMKLFELGLQRGLQQRQTIIQNISQIWGFLKGLWCPKTLSLLSTWGAKINTRWHLLQGPLLYCFSSIYYRSQIYPEPVSDWLKHQTDHCSITHNPLCFSPVSKVLILCLLL